MNIVKEAYCRTFQTVFRVALPVLPYRNPHLLRHVESVPKILQERGKSHPLIVTDTTISSLGLTDKLKDALTQYGIDFSVFDGTKQNPTSAVVTDAYNIYKDDECDCLIAFGGGSPIDCAKAVGVLVARPNKTLDDLAGILKVHSKLPFLVAIPTTAGTGSETTLAAVIVDDATRHKYVINDFPLIPDYAVLDVENIHSLPHSVAAATGMDALTHAVEAYIGRSTTKETRSDSVRAVKLIFANIEDAADHKSAKSEENMLMASHLAGRAFTRSYVGYVHAVSHSLSGEYDMPHGLTNAILLPKVLEMYGEAVYTKLAKLAREVGLGYNADTDEELAKLFIKNIYDMNERLGIPDVIEGIDPDDIDKLAANADKEANPLYPVPVLWGVDKLKEVYRKAGEHHDN